LLPFLHGLIALRILIPPGAPTQIGMNSARQEISAPTHLSGYAVSSDTVSHSNTMIADIVEADDCIHAESMSRALADKEVYARLRFIGVGRKAWELGKFYTVPVAEDERSTPTQEFTSINGTGNAGNRISTTDDIVASTIQTHHSTSNSSVSTPNYEGAAAKPAPTRSLKGKTTMRPKSSLGKHHREASSPSSPPHTLCSKVNNTTASSREKVVWRRQIRRVGWKVLKHWEIWALDAQEI